MFKYIGYTVIYIFIIIIFTFLTIANNFAYAFKSKNSVTITSIEKEELTGKHFVSVTINNLIKIKEILIIEENGRKLVKVPEYVSKEGKVYTNIVIMSEKIKKDIEDGIILEIPGAKGNKKLDYKIKKIFFLQSKSRRANLEIIFNDDLKVICGVMEDKTGELWIAWPSRKDVKLGWIEQVTFINQKFKKIVEEEILAKYRAAKSEESD